MPWNRNTKTALWIGGGLAVGAGAYFGVKALERHVPTSATAPVTARPSTSGATFTVGTVFLRTTATRTGYPLTVQGSVSPTLTGSGVTLTIQDAQGHTLATVTSGTAFAVNVTESTAGAYALTWTLAEQGRVLARSRTPFTGYWIDPTASNALVLFAGNATALQDYLAAFPYQAGVQTPANALSYAVQNTLAGTEFGFAVAGLKHSVANGIVTNTVVSVPSGASVSYVSKGSDPVTAGYELVGKVVNGQLWQVFAQPSSSSGSGSSGSSSSGSGGSSGSNTTLSQQQALYQSNLATLTALQQQSSTNAAELTSLQAAIAQLQAQLASTTS